MKRIIFIFAIATIFGSKAQSAASLCHPFSDFSRKLTRCEDNEALAEEALRCVEAYYDHVQEGQSRVRKKFEIQISSLKSQQSDSFDKTKAGYEDARKSLQDLVSDGKTTRAIVDGLYENLYFPEDWDKPSFTGMTVEYYLRTEPCFAIPNRVMLQAQQMIDKMMLDLSAVNFTANQKEQGAQSRSTNVQTLTPSAVTGTKAQGSAVPATKGTSPKSASDITGSKKAIDDANKAKSLLQQQPKN